MSFFRKKRIVTQETLGELLRKVRLGKNWTLEQAATKTKIASHYLLSLEKSLYDEIPGEVYIKNFIKVYGQKLGLDPKECLEKYVQEKHIIEQKKQRYFLKEISKVKLEDLLLKPRTIKISLICIVVILVLSYITLNIYQTIAPPALEIYFPQDNLKTDQLVISVQGKSDEQAIVRINNQTTLLGQDGSFKETMTLRYGLNLITIKAKKKHGLVKKVLRHILVNINESNNLTKSGSQSHTLDF
jgi:cytoskeletal protein RodZ